jgi:pyruvate dehydrogenase E2 component (dihydrolipoamide acetyltransferase)
MPTDVIMPQMGESIFEGTITKWLKKPGDPVEKDEPLFEISTDKVDAEIPSPIAGVLSEIKFPEGATVQVNTVVAVLSENGSSVAATGTQEKSAPTQAATTHVPKAQLAPPQVVTSTAAHPHPPPDFSAARQHSPHASAPRAESHSAPCANSP